MNEIKTKRERRDNPVARLMRRAYTVREFCAAFRVSHSHTYMLINSGKLESFMLGGKRLIVAESADRLMRSAPTEMSDLGAAARQRRADQIAEKAAKA